MLKITIVMSLLFPSLSCGYAMEPLFDYDLHFSSLPGSNERVMICCHGYGGNYEFTLSLRDLGCTEATLISFNFPEHDINQGREYDPRQATFGTIHELLPALYVMKQVVIDQGIDSLDLYGRSAGGGALINVIGVLNTSTYDAELKEIDIGSEEKERLLAAIQRGVVILDTPLKSVEEIIEFRGATEELEILAKNYRDNNLRPIDSLKLLQGLSLDILLHFQENDEILSNRDDSIYIERLRATQPECKVTVIIGDDGGHVAPHRSLWQSYAQKMDLDFV